MSRKIHLIRHGATKGTQEKILYGSTELPLTEEGRAEIARTREEGLYPSAQGALCFTSGMRRAEETFELIYGDTPREIMPDLREIDLGEFEMMCLEEATEHEIIRSWLSRETDAFSFPGGDDHSGFRARTERAAADLMERGLPQHDVEGAPADPAKAPATNSAAGPEKDIIAVCHGGVIIEIMDILLPHIKDDSWQWLPAPGYGYSIEVEGKTATGYTQIK